MGAPAPLHNSSASIGARQKASFYLTESEILGPDKRSLCERTQVTYLALPAKKGFSCLEKIFLDMDTQQLIQLLQAPTPGKHQELSMAVCREKCRIPNPLLKTCWPNVF